MNRRENSMRIPANNRKGTTVGLLILLMLLGLFAAACGGTDTEQANEGDVNREDLINPAEDGEEALTDLPEVNPPLGASDPRLVGSEDMTIAEFVEAIGGDLNAKWQALFESGGYSYSNASFVLYDEPMPIAGCEGVANPEMGPFYCSENSTVYYPLSWTDSSGRTPAEIGDFAVAVILAHEVGHHVQNLTGAFADPNAYNIELELQADCFAGLWGRSVYEEGLLEPGDVGEALHVAADASDLPGTPAEDPSAHGTESQRTDAFFVGYESGKVGQCQF
jgi:predicted metalloprotease